MAKRPNPKPEEEAKAASTPHTQGADDAGKPDEAPIPAAGAAVQQQPGGGVDSDAEAPADPTGIDVADAVTAVTEAVTQLVAPPITPTKAGAALKVTGPKRGRRRIGMAFGAEPVLIPMDRLSPDEVTALHADPALTVELVQEP